MMTQKRRDIKNMKQSGGNSNKLSYKEVEKSPNDYYDLLVQIYAEEVDSDEDEEEEL